jgi:hypothetical protein
LRAFGWMAIVLGGDDASETPSVLARGVPSMNSGISPTESSRPPSNAIRAGQVSRWTISLVNNVVVVWHSQQRGHRLPKYRHSEIVLRDGAWPYNAHTTI